MHTIALIFAAITCIMWRIYPSIANTYQAHPKPSTYRLKAFLFYGRFLMTAVSAILVLIALA